MTSLASVVEASQGLGLSIYSNTSLDTTSVFTIGPLGPCPPLGRRTKKM